MAYLYSFKGGPLKRSTEMDSHLCNTRGWRMSKETRMGPFHFVRSGETTHILAERSQSSCSFRAHYARFTPDPRQTGLRRQLNSIDLSTSTRLPIPEEASESASLHAVSEPDPETGFFYRLGNYKSLCALRGRRKNQPQSTQRSQSFFLVKTKNTNPFMNMHSFLPFDPPGMKTRG